MLMEGWGRNVPVLQKFNPQEITLIDINDQSIDYAKEKFENDSNIKPF